MIVICLHKTTLNFESKAIAIASKTGSPSSLFEKFFADREHTLEHIRIKSITNANIKESHNFDNDVDTAKGFIFIFLFHLYIFYYFYNYNSTFSFREIPHVLGKESRFANYCRIITHVKE